jgi:hypothetical protein
MQNLFVLQVTRRRTFRQLFIFLRPPPLLGFVSGWSGNFVDSESVPIQSVKDLQCTVHVYGLQYNQRLPPPPSLPHGINCIHLLIVKGARVLNLRECR